jgi:hypothetical protein
MGANQCRDYQYADGLRHCFSWACHSYNAVTPFMFGSSPPVSAVFIPIQENAASGLVALTAASRPLRAALR